MADEMNKVETAVAQAAESAVTAVKTSNKAKYIAIGVVVVVVVLLAVFHGSVLPQ